MSEGSVHSTEGGRTLLTKTCAGAVSVRTEEHSRVSQLTEHIQHIQGAIQAITQELRAHGAGAEEESDKLGWAPKTSKKRRKGVQPWVVRLKDTRWELEQLMDVLRRREAVQECEWKIADLMLAAEEATAEASRQQIELVALRKEVEERDSNWHAGEEEGFSVTKSRWEDG